MNKKMTIVIVVILALVIISGTWYFLTEQHFIQKPLRAVVIDPGHTAASTLLLVARDRGYFAQQGLNVSFAYSPSVSVAVQNLLDHRIDFVLLHEYSLSDPKLYNTSIRVIGTLADSDNNYVVGRRDRGILRIQDLEGKTIGVSEGTVNEYLMDRFFVVNGISEDNVTIVDIPQEKMVNELAGGNIDASFSPEPYVYQMRQQMGADAVVWPTNLGQHLHFSLACDESTLKGDPDIAEAVLASALEAESYVNSHPDEAKKIARVQTGFDEQYMNQDWQNHHFAVGLSQSLITSMEDETRWRIRENLTNITEVPDFSNDIYPDILSGLKPSSVTLIQ